jgi:hypothetical protein
MSEQIVFCPVTKTKGTNHSKADSEIIYTFSYVGILSISKAVIEVKMPYNTISLNRSFI